MNAMVPFTRLICLCYYDLRTFYRFTTAHAVTHEIRRKLNRNNRMFKSQIIARLMTITFARVIKTKLNYFEAFARVYCSHHVQM